MKSQYRVIGFDLPNARQTASGTETVPVELTLDDSVAKAVEEVRQRGNGRIASVVHLAAYYDTTGRDHPKYDAVTVQGTRRLLSALKTLETDVEFNQVAVEMWSGRPGRAAELAEVLGALLQERRRQREVLSELHQRLESLAADDDFHEHLDPVEQWKQFVHQRLFETPPQE